MTRGRAKLNLGGDGSKLFFCKILVQQARDVYTINTWRKSHGMEDAAAAVMATTRRTRSWSTLGRRADIHRFSVNNCGDRLDAYAMTKRCPTGSGESHDLAGCAPLSAPTSSNKGYGREEKKNFSS